ncbi:MAG: hypothetical protein P8Y71_27305 [Pseudolabrys sp.]|jgi:hypothetical protein
MPSLEIKILLLIAFAACIYLFIAEIRRSRRISRLIAWVEANYPEKWNALPWANRKINRLGGLALISKQGMIPDQHFAAEYNATRPFGKNQSVAFAIAVGAITLVLLGVKLKYWHW